MMSKRIQSIDALRGLVMVIMAIDHSRDLLHISSLTQNPTDLATTTPFLYFTRWITHLCAPTFVFLSGVSAYLSMKNQGNIRASRKFLLTRGAWLILLEFTVIGLGIWFDLQFRTFMFQVIGAIGFGLIILSLLLKLTPKAIGIIGVSIIFLHSLVPLILLSDMPALQTIFNLFLGVSFFNITEQTVFFINYPPIPWLGIMLTGFGFAKVFELDIKKTKKILVQAGIASIILFLVLRGWNLYGDPVGWKAEKNSLFTFLSFMNVSKYPPSLLYTLITIGISLAILGLFYSARNKLFEVLSVYGKVPLFYYIIHWYIIHTIMVLLMFGQGFSWKELNFGSFGFGRPSAPSGVELPFVYLIWLGVVLLLYPICKWYGAYKAKHPEKWYLRYL